MDVASLSQLVASQAKLIDDLRSGSLQVSINNTNTDSQRDNGNDTMRERLKREIIDEIRRDGLSNRQAVRGITVSPRNDVEEEEEEQLRYSSDENESGNDNDYHSDKDERKAPLHPPVSKALKSHPKTFIRTSSSPVDIHHKTTTLSNFNQTSPHPNPTTSTINGHQSINNRNININQSELKKHKSAKALTNPSLKSSPFQPPTPLPIINTRKLPPPSKPLSNSTSTTGDNATTNKVDPLSPLSPPKKPIKLDSTTLHHLNKSAKLINDATGREFDSDYTHHKQSQSHSRGSDSSSPSHSYSHSPYNQLNVNAISSVGMPPTQIHSTPGSAWFENSIGGGESDGGNDDSRESTLNENYSRERDRKRDRKPPRNNSHHILPRSNTNTSNGVTSTKLPGQPLPTLPASHATVRTTAEHLNTKLLGPLNLTGHPINKSPLPSSLVESEWENEIARNIVALYSNKVVQEIKVKRESEEIERRKKELSRKGYSAEQIEEIARGEKAASEGKRPNTNTNTSTKGSRNKDKNINTNYTASSLNAPSSYSSSMAQASIYTVGLSTSNSTVLSKLFEGVGEDFNHDGEFEDKLKMFDEAGVEALHSGKVSLDDGRREDEAYSASHSISSASASVSALAKKNAKRPIINLPIDGDKGKDKAIINIPQKPKAIWFGGTGAIQAEWGALQDFATASPSLRKDLESLAEKGKYTQYIALIEGLLTAAIRVQVDEKTTQLMERLWRQMVVTCNAFGVRCLEQKKFAHSLELLDKAMEMASIDFLPRHLMQELKAFVMDSYAYYYMKRNKCSAALQYITSAMKSHSKREDWAHVAKCHLHTSVILSKLGRHDESIKCLGQVLTLVDEGLLEVGTNNAQQLLLVAVAYHNIAVEQLILRHVTESCMSSQNARRLARLCLSYSNRYLKSFEATHLKALKELAASVRHKHDYEQHEIFTKLAENLYE